MRSYENFVTINDKTFDFGTGEIKFSEQENLRLVL
jgi:hypothetical protein